MADRELKIRVITSGDPSGADKVTKSVKAATDATKADTTAQTTAASAATKLVAAENAVAAAEVKATVAAKAETAAVAELAPAHDKAEAAAKGHEKANERMALGSVFLDKAVYRLGEAFPTLGSLIGKVFLPLTIAIKLFEVGKEKIDEWNKELDEAGEKAAEPMFRDGIMSRKKALEDGIVASVKYRQELATRISDEDIYIRKMQDRLEVLKAIHAAEIQVAEAVKSNKEEEINRAERQGKITPTQAAAQRGALAIATSSTAAHDAKARADEIANKEDQLAHDKEMAAKLGPTVESAQTNDALAQGKVAKNAADLAARLAQKAELDRKAADVINALGKARDALDSKDPTGNLARLAAFLKARREAELPVLKRDANDRAIAVLTRRGLAAQSEAAVTSSQKANAEGDLTEKTKEIARLEAEIDLLKKKDKIATDAANSAGGLDKERIASKGIGDLAAAGPLGAAAVTGVEQAEEIAKRVLERKGNVTGSERDEMRGIARTGSGNNNLTDDQAASYLRVQSQSQEKTFDLTKRIVEHGTKLANLHNGQGEKYLQALQTVEAITAAHQREILTTNARLSAALRRTNLPPP